MEIKYLSNSRLKGESYVCLKITLRFSINWKTRKIFNQMNVNVRFSSYNL